VTINHLEADLRHYRHQHRENIHMRNWWLRLMEGQRTFSVRRYEDAAKQCRELAREKIEILRGTRNGH
jgi:hypothetical protein